MKKTIAFVLSVIMIMAFLTSCGTSSNDENDTSNASISVESGEIVSEDTKEPETPEVEEIEFIPPEDTVIYSENDIEVVYQKIKGTKYFKYEVLNNSERDIQYVINGVAVNGCMVYDLVAGGTVTAAKKAVEEYTLVGAKDYGIDEVETLDINFTFTDGATFKTIDEVTCHIDLVPTAKFKYSNSAPMFYSDDYVSCYVEMDGDKYEDFNVIYQNTSDEVLSVALSEVSINDIMIKYNIKSAFILPGCYAHTGASNGTVTVWSSIENEINEKITEPISDIDAKLLIWNDQFDFGLYTSDTFKVLGV